MSKIRGVNLINQKFGTLTVIGYEFRFNTRRNSNDIYWKCQCDCGNIKFAMTRDLTKRGAKFCIKCTKKYNPKWGNNKERVKKASERSKKGITDLDVIINSVYAYYKNSAKNRGLELSLEKEQFIKIICSNCEYCNSPPSMIKTTKNRDSNTTFFHNGIDRVNNSLGYVEGNVVPCCSMCNYMKRSYLKDDFLSQIEKIYFHSIKKNISNGMQ